VAARGAGAAGNRAVQLPEKLEFVFNLKTAKALGIQIPPGGDGDCRRGDRIKPGGIVCRPCRPGSKTDIFRAAQPAERTRRLNRPALLACAI
jgi:hypothetical protein